MKGEASQPASPTGPGARVGLAWLLGTSGVLLDVSSSVTGGTIHRGGNRLTFRRRGNPANAAPAWTL